MANWSTALKKCTRDEQIIAALVASNDYLYQAQTSGGPEILRSHPFP